ncbi:hypothetical protein OH492_13945 [Vibrio chagasii]|nr:hypothetical protein [Vibrio chagasii]
MAGFGLTVYGIFTGTGTTRPVRDLASRLCWCSWLSSKHQLLVHGVTLWLQRLLCSTQGIASCTRSST